MKITLIATGFERDAIHTDTRTEASVVREDRTAEAPKAAESTAESSTEDDIAKIISMLNRNRNT